MLRGPGFKCNFRRCFAETFREWRRKKRIPLKQVATISKWERGERFPTGQNLELLVAYTSQPPYHLFCALARRCHSGRCLLNKSPRG